MVVNQEITKDQVQEALDILDKTKVDGKKKFNDGLKKLLMYIGYIMSALGAVGYIATIVILVKGVGDLNFELIGKDGLFFILNFVFGLWIRVGLYTQGVIYAKREFEETIKKYHKAKAKEKRERNVWSFFRTYEFRMGLAVFINTAFQLIMLVVSSLGVIYLTGFEGIGNKIYIYNAFSNLTMFAGFGLLAINSSYEKYVNFKIPVIEEKTKDLIKEREEFDRLEQERIEQERVKLEQERLEQKRLENEQLATEKAKEHINDKEMVKEERSKDTDSVVDDNYIGWFDTTPNI